MAGISANPYVGPRPFPRGQRLYGRDRELRELFDLLVARRIVLLHSPSGAGKSSLVQAALIPRLKRKRFDVWRTVRLNLDPGVLEAKVGNRFVASTLASLEDGVPEPYRRGFAAIADMSLARYQAERPRRSGAPPSVVLIFDQFEEILTIDPLDFEAKREFFAQLGEALRQGDYWALFALREDYLAALSPYRDLVPTKLANTYRIDLLDREAAREAIVEPAGTGGRAFPAADLLIDDLRTMQVQQPDGSFVAEQGSAVEPVQLQVVCLRLWDAMPEDDLSIDAEDLEQFGDVGKALGHYYRDSVEDIAGGDMVRQRAMREWFGERLIAAGGVRGQVLREVEASGNLANELIECLLDTHLVRAEKRAGATWYELAHDRLVGPIEHDNAAWRDENLSEVQRRAALWEQEDRPSGLLLQDEVLARGERWAAENRASLAEVDGLFLEASRTAQSGAERVRRQALWIRRLAIAAMVFALLALAVGVFARLKWQEAEQARERAERQARIATSSRLATEAFSRASGWALGRGTGRPDLAWLLAVEAWNVANIVEAKKALLSTVQLVGGELGGDGKIQWLEMSRRVGEELTTFGTGGLVAFSPNGSTLALSSAGGTVWLWDVASRQPLGEPLSGDEGWMWSVAFSPDGTTLASGSDDGTVRLWDIASRQPLAALPIRGNRVNSVTFSPDGTTLVSGGEDGIWLWDVASWQPLGALAGGSEDEVTSVAFSLDGTILASGSGDGAVWLWDVARRQPLGAPLTGHEGEVVSIAFNLDGTILASGSSEGEVWLWGVASRQPLGAMPMRSDVTSVAFSPDGTTLASGGDEGEVWLWDVGSRQPLSALLHGCKDVTLGPSGAPSVAFSLCGVSSVAFSPDGAILASGSFDDGTVWLWDVDPDSWTAHACRRANRNLSLAEWQQYLGVDVPYRRTCPGLPPGLGAPGG